MKRTIMVAFVVVLVVLGLGFLGIRRMQHSTVSASTQPTVTVQRGSLTASVSASGSVESADAVDLSFQTSGQVKEIKVQEGDTVKAGQEIARLDTTDADLQVAQAQLALDNANAALAQAKKGPSAEELASARAALVSAQENLKALQAGPSADDVQIAKLKVDQAKDQLWSAQCQRDATCGNPRSGSSACDQANASVASAEIAVQVAQLQYEEAQQGPTAKDLAAAQAQVAQAQLNLSNLTSEPTSQDISNAESQVKQAQISLQQAQEKVAQCSLTAPADGTIVSLGIKVGQFVGSNSQVVAATLAGAGGMQVTADLSEVDVANIKVGQPVQVTLDAIPGRTFAGTVTDVATTGINTQGVVNFPVTVQLEQPDAAVKPGMTANIAITVDHRDNVLIVPSRAIQTVGNQHIVQVVQDGQSIQVPVQIGLVGDNGTEILGNTLHEGDVLAVSGTASGSSGATGRFAGGMAGARVGGGGMLGGLFGR